MSRQSLPFVSIVTPAYNEEAYLSACIESVLAQTFSNWEYIIVNNCSSDSTLAIAQRYAAQDSRIRLVTNESVLPAVANFNRALQQISPYSKYCKMVLADDWMFPECVARMIALAEAHPSIGIVGSYSLAGSEVWWDGLPYPSDCISGREICRRTLLGGPYVFGSQTTVLFRSDLVRSHDPLFSSADVAADREACMELLKESDFGFVHQVLTFSRPRPESMVARTMRLNAQASTLLYELRVYGPYYLTAEEQERELKSVMRKYYQFLAKNLLRRREREFWDYHKNKLKELAGGFSRVRLTTTLGKLLLTGVYRRFTALPEAPRWGL